jgi:hypothetical protein
MKGMMETRMKAQAAEGLLRSAPTFVCTRDFHVLRRNARMERAHFSKDTSLCALIFILFITTTNERPRPKSKTDAGSGMAEKEPSV